MISSPKGLMISTTLRAVMIYHYSVMDKKSRIKMIRLFWCEKRDYALEFCKGKNRNFIYARNGTGSRTAVLGPYADLTIPRMVIQHRSRFKPRFKIRAQKKSSRSYSFFVVRETGLEPVRANHTPLKRARLPIPPLSQI